MHKPWHSLVFGVVVFSMLGLLSFTFPENGITISKNLNLNFPGLNSILGLNSAKKDISKIIEAVDAIDTSFTVNDPEDLQQSDSSGKVSEKIDDKKMLLHKLKRKKYLQRKLSWRRKIPRFG